MKRRRLVEAGEPTVMRWIGLDGKAVDMTVVMNLYVAEPEPTAYDIARQYTETVNQSSARDSDVNASDDAADGQ